jgi:hypothetical protein
MPAMGLLARLLLGPPRAPADIGERTIDLERFTVYGLAGRAAQDEIERWLGPPEDYFERRAGRLLYPALGLRVYLDAKRRLDTVEVLVSHDPGHVPEPGAPVPFAGRWAPWGRAAAPSEAELVAVLGPPSVRDVDDEEVALDWEGERRFVSAEYALDGALRVLHLELEIADDA